MRKRVSTGPRDVEAPPMTTKNFPDAGFRTLREAVRGPVLPPGDEGYDDVRAAVGCAAAHGPPVAVQATGHGLSVAADGGMPISTRRMREVRIDARARTAWFGAGVVRKQVVGATAPHGLAPLGGSAAGVGPCFTPWAAGPGCRPGSSGTPPTGCGARRSSPRTAGRGTSPRRAIPSCSGRCAGRGSTFGVVTGLEVDLVPVERVLGADCTSTARRWRTYCGRTPTGPRPCRRR